jgi:hypothetical protein
MLLKPWNVYGPDGSLQTVLKVNTTSYLYDLPTADSDRYTVSKACRKYLWNRFNLRYGTDAVVTPMFGSSGSSFPIANSIIVLDPQVHRPAPRVNRPDGQVTYFRCMPPLELVYVYEEADEDNCLDREFWGNLEVFEATGMLFRSLLTGDDGEPSSLSAAWEHDEHEGFREAHNVPRFVWTQWGPRGPWGSPGIGLEPLEPASSLGGPPADMVPYHIDADTIDRYPGLLVMIDYWLENRKPCPYLVS